jgi:hypothetical protein
LYKTGIEISYSGNTEKSEVSLHPREEFSFNRVVANQDALLDHCCDTWNRRTSPRPSYEPSCLLACPIGLSGSD